MRVAALYDIHGIFRRWMLCSKKSTVRMSITSLSVATCCLDRCHTNPRALAGSTVPCAPSHRVHASAPFPARVRPTSPESRAIPFSIGELSVRSVSVR